jgi:prefoldin subunit 5
MGSAAEQQLATLKKLKSQLEKLQPRTEEIAAAIRHHQEEIAVLEKQLRLARGESKSA